MIKTGIFVRMDSKRQQKFSKLILKELSVIFQSDIKGMFENSFITVTNANVSPDLGVAKVYLSFMLVNDKNVLLENIRSKSKAIRQMLANKIRHQVRVIPELVFFLDDSTEYAIKMNSIIDNLHIPKEDKET